MPTEPSPRTPTPPDPGGEAHGDWPAQATETIVGLVDTVRQKTTGPATTAVRAAVWGLLIAIVGTAALVLFLVLFVTGPVFLVAGFMGWTTAQFLKTSALLVVGVLVAWALMATGQLAETE